MRMVSPPSPSDNGVRKRSHPGGHNPFAANLKSTPSAAISEVPVIIRLGPGDQPIVHAPIAANAISEGAIAASHIHDGTRTLSCAARPHHAPPIKLNIKPE